MKLLFLIAMCLLNFNLISSASNDQPTGDRTSQIKNLREFYANSYKKLLALLKEDKVKPGEWLAVKGSFDLFAKEKDIEKITKTKREWFERVSKGCSVLFTLKNTYNNKLMFKQLKKAEQAKQGYIASKARLIEIVKARKKEYSTK